MSTIMRLSIFLVLTLCSIQYSYSNSQPACMFEDILRPRSILVDNQHIYVAEPTTVHIYNCSNNKKVGQFGKRGEGPQEFQPMRGKEGLLSLTFHKNMLVVGSSRKLNFYQKNGTFIRTLKVRAPGSIISFRPFGEGFAGSGFSGYKGKYGAHITIYDKNFQVVKNIFRSEVGLGFFNPYLMTQLVSHSINPDGLFLINENTKSVETYSETGKIITKHPLNLKSSPLTAEDRKRTINSILREDASTKERKIFEKITEFPSFYPLAINIIKSEDVLYLTRWEKVDGKNILIMLNASDGSLIKKTSVQLQFLNEYQPFPFTYHDGHLYAIHVFPDDDDDEVYGLVKVKVN